MKSVRPVLIGFGTTFVFIMLLETIGGLLWPAPRGINLNDMQAVLAARAAAPLAAKLYVALTYGIAIFIGAFLARKVAGGINTIPSWIVGGIFTAIRTYTAFTMHEPLWMQIASIGVCVPAAWLGMTVAAERRRISTPQ